MAAPTAPRLFAGVGIAAGVLANALGIAIVLVSRSQPQRAPITADYALGCGLFAAFGVGILVVLLGGLCSLIGLGEARRGNLSPVPAAVGLALNLIPPFAAFAGDALGWWVR